MGSILLVSEVKKWQSHGPVDVCQILCVLQYWCQEVTVNKGRELCSFWPMACKDKRNIPQLRGENPTVIDTMEMGGTGEEGD